MKKETEKAIQEITDNGICNSISNANIDIIKEFVKFQYPNLKTKSIDFLAWKIKR